MCLLLPNAAPVIRLFGDASFADGLNLGAWAFCIPGWGLEGSGVCAGPSAEWFEFTASVTALEHVSRLDGTDRLIRVHSDSDFVIKMIECASRAQELPKRRSTVRVQDLYARTLRLGFGQRVHAVKCDASVSEHGVCDRMAKRALRAYFDENPKLACQSVLQREQATLRGLLRARANLEKERARVNSDISRVQIRIQALQHDAEAVFEQEGESLHRLFVV